MGTACVGICQIAPRCPFERWALSASRRGEDASIKVRSEVEVRTPLALASMHALAHTLAQASTLSKRRGCRHLSGERPSVHLDLVRLQHAALQ